MVMKRLATLLAIYAVCAAALLANVGGEASATLGGCCICACEPPRQTVCGMGDDCPDVLELCSQLNVTSCNFNETRDPCSEVPACAATAPAAAPLFGPTGLTVMALLLGGVGVWQAARRTRRGGGAR